MNFAVVNFRENFLVTGDFLIKEKNGLVLVLLVNVIGGKMKLFNSFNKFISGLGRAASWHKRLVNTVLLLLFALFLGYCIFTGCRLSEVNSS